ncbi:phosphatase PAP2 family protein [Robertmurraya kyonggiensis]|nr:phosphatase PAP2 family protein [Robertmurraya kyonggiensis]
MELNIELFRMINDLGKEYAFLNPIFVFFAKYTIYFVIIAVLYYLFTKSSRMMVISSVVSVAVAEILAIIAKKLHSNQQPFAELPDVNQLVEKAVGNSFPSDHTIIVFALCLSFWIFKRGWHFVWILLAIIVGFSRIGVGVHYPADVGMGALLSLVSVIIVSLTLPKWGMIQKWFGQDNPNISKEM